MLVVFPLGLLITAVIFDAIHLGTGNDTFSQVGFWNITAGAIGAVLAAAFGVADWTAIPGGTRARAVGLRHGALNVVALVLFVIAWLVRLDRPAHTLGAGLFVLELVAVAIAGVAAWFGGELVERHGVGVDAHAELDAPSSLTTSRPTA
jgi:uncharacterized membrane protein